MKIVKNFRSNLMMGFSLLQVTVAAGMASGLSLVVMELNKNQQMTQKSVQTNFEINQTLSHLQNVLLDRENCTSNFIVGSTPTLKQANKLVAKGDVTVLDTSLNSEYKKRGFEIVSIDLVDTTVSNVKTIDINFRRIQNSMAGAPDTTITRKIIIKLQLDSGGRVLSCYSDLSDAVTGALRVGVENSCVHPGFVFDGSDPNNPRCVLDPAPGATTVMNCADPTNSISTASVTHIGNGKYRFNTQCKPLADCPTGIGIIENNQITCYTCPAGRIGLYTNSGFRCIDAMCGDIAGAISYLAGIDGDGNKQCKALVLETELNCGDYGFRLFTDSSGSAKVECCRCDINGIPTQTSSYCEGTTHPAHNTNNCNQNNVCKGTKARVPYTYPDDGWGPCGGRLVAGDNNSCVQTRNRVCNNRTNGSTYDCCYAPSPEPITSRTCYGSGQWAHKCDTSTETAPYPSNVVCENGCCHMDLRPNPITCTGRLRDGRRTYDDCSRDGGYVENVSGVTYCNMPGTCNGNKPGWIYAANMTSARVHCSTTTEPVNGQYPSYGGSCNQECCNTGQHRYWDFNRAVESCTYTWWKRYETWSDTWHDHSRCTYTTTPARGYAHVDRSLCY